MKNIVLNIPHSSINGIYDEKYGKWCKSPLFINNIVNKWTDWYTDYLFSVDNSNIKKVVFPYSRFVCDAERLESDEMEKIGQGIAYTSFNDYRRTISEEEKERIIGLWKEHQNKLVECIDKDTVLIDCHSFPSELSETDICIGFNDDWSYDENIVEMIKSVFTKKGYSVSMNTPYSNSITPKTNFEYKSVMIEVNKRVYMNEKTLSLNPNIRQWMRWNSAIKEIYVNILNDKQ